MTYRSPISFSFFQEQITVSTWDQDGVLHGLMSATLNGRTFIIAGSKTGATWWIPGDRDQLLNFIHNMFPLIVGNIVQLCRSGGISNCLNLVWAVRFLFRIIYFLLVRLNRLHCVMTWSSINLFWLLCPRPLDGGIKRWCCLTSVCLTSVTYIGPKSRTERHRKIKIGTEVAHVTRDSDTTFKVKRSNKGQGHRGPPLWPWPLFDLLWWPPAQLVIKMLKLGLC